MSPRPRRATLAALGRGRPRRAAARADRARARAACSRGRRSTGRSCVGCGIAARRGVVVADVLHARLGHRHGARLRPDRDPVRPGAARGIARDRRRVQPRGAAARRRPLRGRPDGARPDVARRRSPAGGSTRRGGSGRSSASARRTWSGAAARSGGAWSATRRASPTGRFPGRGSRRGSATWRWRRGCSSAGGDGTPRERVAWALYRDLLGDAMPTRSRATASCRSARRCCRAPYRSCSTTCRTASGRAARGTGRTRPLDRWWPMALEAWQGGALRAGRAR